MAEAAKDQDQSMEEILQSIKRIIAEEGDPAPEAAGSDVLELTEQLEEDGSITRVEAGEKAPPALATMSIEEIMAAPISSTHVEVAPEPVPVAAVPMGEKPVSSADSLISGATFSASVAALNALRDSMASNAHAAPLQSASFRSGVTVEDLVIESLKPMLKEWLDANLAEMVKAMVSKEISKLTQ